MMVKSSEYSTNGSERIGPNNSSILGVLKGAL